jgi:nucleolin
MPKYQDSGRCLGYAHVTFESRKQAVLALKKNKQVLMGRYLEITPAKGEKVQERVQGPVPPGCRTIFVKNLPYGCTEDQVGEYFSRCGPVANIRFAFNAVLKHFKGFGYVDFKFEDSVTKALALDGQEFQGRLLRIDAEEGAARKGYHNYVIKNSKFGSA